MAIRREFPLHPLAGVGAVVIWHERILLVRRLRPPLAGLWSLPGGLIELGESARDAAAREVKEETGLAVEVGPVITVVDRIEWTPDGRVQYHYLVADFLATVAPGVFPDSAASPPLRAASDAGEARWFTREDLAALALTPGLDPVLQLAWRLVRTPGAS